MALRAALQATTQHVSHPKWTCQHHGWPQDGAEDVLRTAKLVAARAALTAVLLAAVVALLMVLSAPGSRLAPVHAHTARLMRGASELPTVRDSPFRDSSVPSCSTELTRSPTCDVRQGC